MISGPLHCEPLCRPCPPSRFSDSTLDAETGRAIRGALLGQNQKPFGRSWPDAPISQQAVAQHLQRSGWSAVEETLHAFEIACKTINYN
jgi:hypothetical protein